MEAEIVTTEPENENQLQASLVPSDSLSFNFNNEIVQINTDTGLQNLIRESEISQPIEAYETEYIVHEPTNNVAILAVEKQLETISYRITNLEKKLDNFHAEIKTALDLILDKLSNIQSNHAENHEIDEFPIKFPIESISELKELEEQLHISKSSQINLIQKISKYGGLDDRRTVKTITTKLFTDELLDQVSWKGTATKISFSSFSKINETICKAVRKLFPNFTESSNAAFFKDYLKQAKFRLQNREKKGQKGEKTNEIQNKNLESSNERDSMENNLGSTNI